MSIKLINKKEVDICSGSQNKCFCDGLNFPWENEIDTESKCMRICCYNKEGNMWAYQNEYAFSGDYCNILYRKS